jgi:acetolactate synthase regulatory subunit
MLQNSKVKVHNIQKNFSVQDIKMTRVKDSENFALNFVVDFELNTRTFSFSGLKGLRMLILLQ